MKLTIITPSLARSSLRDCCQSVDQQVGCDSWEHIICFDCAESDLNSDLMFSLAHPRRQFLCCGEKFGHFGNHARWLAWEKATGDYLVMLDDDNRMFRPDALANIARFLQSANLPDFALFPIHRHGSIFLYDPPGMCRTDSANIVVKRELGRWPDISAREADGVLVCDLMSKYTYIAFFDCQPIILMERSSNGE